MRRLILFWLMAALALPALAAKRVTVAQLEQSLTAAAAEHKPDADLLRLISGFELAERLSDTTLDRLSSHIQMSPQVALALQLLADQSAFLDLPAAELPPTLAPDEPSQLRMMNAAGKYVAETLLRLPNFLATRTTNRFDDSPQEVKKGAWPVRAGFHLVDRSSRETSVQAERENQPVAGGSALSQQNRGLTSWGEFGSVLGMILSDAVNGKVNWSHWEQPSGTQLAVFNYSVPRTASHFELVSPLNREPAVESFATPRGGSRVSTIGARPNQNPSSTATTRETRAYRGSLWLDPVSGTILRITIEADSRGSSSFQRAAMLVEYGAVRIADSTFTCPVRSLALSRSLIGAEASTGDAPSAWLNETLFTDYHRFASTTRIVSEPPAPNE